MNQPQYTSAIRKFLAEPQARYAIAPGATSPITRSHFTVANESTGLQMPAWADYVGRIMQVPVARSRMHSGFRGEIRTYVAQDLIFLDCRTDAFCQSRSAGHISRDSMRDYVFHIAVEGIIEARLSHQSEREVMQYQPGVLALDMAQTMQMVRPTYARVLAFFLPRHTVEAAIPDAPSIHGRVVGYNSPIGRLLQEQLRALIQGLATLDDHALAPLLQSCAALIVAAFARQAKADAGARGAVRLALQDSVRRYINANLYMGTLTVEHLLAAFPVPRASLYRMFEDEGGLAVYIRNCRLREAASELVRAPYLTISDIARDLGFQSASSFSRAFRRNYGVAPQDFRMRQLDW